MQLLIQLMHQIPAGWPRWTILIATAVVYFLFPGVVKKITRNKLETKLVTEITQYLQMKKLLFEVEVLKKEKNLTDLHFPGEKTLQDKLNKLDAETERAKVKAVYRERLIYSMLGAAAFFVITVLIGIISGISQQKSILVDLILSAGCGAVASFLPAGNHRTSFIYGMTIPIPLVALYLIVRH